MGSKQLAWLERELAQADQPMVLFIHQPSYADLVDCLEDSAAVRAVL